DRRRPERRLAEIARRRPNQRAKDASAVERKSRDEVEHADDDVDRAEPEKERRQRPERRDGAEHVTAPRDLCRNEERSDHRHRDAERDARQWPDDRDEELGLRRRRLVRDVGHTAEEEEPDLTNLYVERSRDERVRELVREHGAEKQNRRRDRERHALAERPVGMPRRKDRREVPADEEEDHDPAQVEHDLNPEEPSDADPASHGLHSCTGRARRGIRFKPRRAMPTGLTGATRRKSAWRISAEVLWSLELPAQTARYQLISAMKYI